MAIKYKDIKKRLLESPLNESELKLIKEAEDFIDRQISAQIEHAANTSVSIRLEIITFEYDIHLNMKYSGIPDERKELMSVELRNRYKDAGWEARVDYGEDDGPNRSGSDYWVLEGIDD